MLSFPRAASYSETNEINAHLPVALFISVCWEGCVWQKPERAGGDKQLNSQSFIRGDKRCRKGRYKMEHRRRKAGAHSASVKKKITFSFEML